MSGVENISAALGWTVHLVRVDIGADSTDRSPPPPPPHPKYSGC